MYDRGRPRITGSDKAQRSLLTFARARGSLSSGEDSGLGDVWLVKRRLGSTQARYEPDTTLQHRQLELADQFSETGLVTHELADAVPTNFSDILTNFLPDFIPDTLPDATADVICTCSTHFAVNVASNALPGIPRILCLMPKGITVAKSPNPLRRVAIPPFGVAPSSPLKSWWWIY